MDMKRIFPDDLRRFGVITRHGGVDRQFGRRIGRLDGSVGRMGHRRQGHRGYSLDSGHLFGQLPDMVMDRFGTVGSLGLIADPDGERGFGFRCGSDLFRTRFGRKRHRRQSHRGNCSDPGHLFGQFILGGEGLRCVLWSGFGLAVDHFDAEGSVWPDRNGDLFLYRVGWKCHLRQGHRRNRFDLGHLFGHFLISSSCSPGFGRFCGPLSRGGVTAGSKLGGSGMWCGRMNGWRRGRGNARNG